MAVVQYTFTHKQYTERHKRNNTYIEQHNNFGEGGPCHVLASYTLAFIDQSICLTTEKKHGKTSVRVATSKNT